VSVFLDTSAVVALHVESPLRRLVIDATARSRTAGGEPSCVSALALTEALALIAKLTDEPVVQADLEDALRLQWDRYAVVPVDQRCLDRAAQLLREQPLRLADALQLAAADRLPRPVTFVTFDPSQIPVALSLGFDVVSN
jgi:predicted nucleic acid-binding protein